MEYARVQTAHRLSRRLPLPQQLTSGPRTQRQSPRHNSDRRQQEEGLGSSIFTPSRFPAACQRSHPSARTQTWLLAPFIHHEVLECYFVSWFAPATTSSPQAHEPQVSMSWSARRLRQEPSDERSAWKFPPGGSSPHWRLDSALPRNR